MKMWNKWRNMLLLFAVFGSMFGNEYIVNKVRAAPGISSPFSIYFDCGTDATYCPETHDTVGSGFDTYQDVYGDEPIPIRPGYKFIGWTNKEDSSSNIIDWDVDTNYEVMNVYLVAVWKEETNESQNTSELQVSVEPITFSVTVPTSLSLVREEGGEVITASDAKIVNNSAVPVEVTNVTITANSGWEIMNYADGMDTAVIGEKRIGFMMNGGETVDGVFDFASADFPQIDVDSELSIDYDAKFPPQYEEIVGANVANVVFTLEWAE